MKIIKNTKNCPGSYTISDTTVLIRGCAGLTNKAQIKLGANLKFNIKQIADVTYEGDKFDLVQLSRLFFSAFTAKNVMFYKLVFWKAISISNKFAIVEAINSNDWDVVVALGITQAAIGTFNSMISEEKAVEAGNIAKNAVASKLSNVIGAVLSASNANDWAAIIGHAKFVSTSAADFSTEINIARRLSPFFESSAEADKDHSDRLIITTAYNLVKFNHNIALVCSNNTKKANTAKAEAYVKTLTFMELFTYITNNIMKPFSIIAYMIENIVNPFDLFVKTREADAYVAKTTETAVDVHKTIDIIVFIAQAMMCHALILLNNHDHIPDLVASIANTAATIYSKITTEITNNDCDNDNTTGFTDIICFAKRLGFTIDMYDPASPTPFEAITAIVKMLEFMTSNVTDIKLSKLLGVDISTCKSCYVKLTANTDADNTTYPYKIGVYNNDHIIQRSPAETKVKPIAVNSDYILLNAHGNNDDNKAILIGLKGHLDPIVSSMNLMNVNDEQVKFDEL